MFSNTIYAAAFFRAVPHDCLGTRWAHSRSLRLYVYSKDWGREGKSPAFPMLNGITPTDHIHLAILTQFIALHILQK